MAEADNGDKKLVMPTIVIVILIAIALLIGSWVLSRGIGSDSSTNEPTTEQPKSLPQNQNIAEPTNPNVTGGSTGAGTNTSNDPNASPPSPAGGADTNNVQPAP